MATQLFFRHNTAMTALPDTHRGTNTAKLDGTATGWEPHALSLTRGTTTRNINTATVTGATNGVEVLGPVTGLGPAEWISAPVAADVTISGTITANIWAAESNMSANVAINVIIDIVRSATSGADGSNTIVNIVKSTNVAELAVTTRAVNNFTTGMTSGAYSAQTLNRGDRLRIRVFGDDVGTMAATFTFNVGWDGPTAAADGDSYVTFTENITFEGPLAQTVRNDQLSCGITGIERLAQPFTAQGSLAQARVWLAKAATPTDNLVLEIQTDNAGDPSGSVVGTVATISGASLTTTQTEYTYSASIALTASTTYWLVYRRSGSLDDTNNFLVGRNSGAASGWTALEYLASSVWTALGGPATVALAFGGSTVYLTDTASAVATASVDREAWTSRGAGNVNDQTVLVNGWTAPLQVTDTQGGTVVDWFTRPLTAFTLTGMAVANLSLGESSAAANVSARCEIARVEGDGTSPTVWANWCIAPLTTDNGELPTVAAARTVNVSGDDLAITNGQRLRIRVYAEDMSSAPMVQTGLPSYMSLFYGATSGGTTGDSYITFPQTLTEYSAPAGGGPAPLRQRRANRFLIVR